MKFLLPLLCIACMAPSAHAALVLRADSATFVEGTAVGNIDVFILSDNADQVFGLVADFNLPDGGDFDVPPGVFGETEAGFFGFSTLNASSDFQRTGPGVSSLSLDFDTATAPPSGEIPLARATVLLNGLTPGTYAFTLSNVSAITTTADPIASTARNGIITITAVPEPAALLPLIIGCAATFSSRRRRSHRVG